MSLKKKKQRLDEREYTTELVKIGKMNSPKL